MDERDVYSAKEAMQSAMKKGPMRLALIIGAILVGFLFLSPWVQIGAGERGIVLNFGAGQKDVLGVGLHFRIPIMQKIVQMDVKVQKSLTKSAASSADLQEVSSEVALNYHIVQDKANI
ncbi:MAG: prohibitin family protein, partial [Nitrospirae bacterium]|nr:prohibitin family protein [Nitrospirota bacterium]